MDLFGDDIDTFYQNDDDLNENIRDGNLIEEAEEENGEKNDEDGDEEGKLDENGDPIKVEPKKRSVRRPQVNFQQLQKRKYLKLMNCFFFDFSCV